MQIFAAEESDAAAILALYKANLGGPADWNEYYPNEETIALDLSRNALYVMKDERGDLLAAISIDEDEEVNALECWNRELMPAGEVSRLCVREDVRNAGIARQMMQYTFDILKSQGMRSVHILVRMGHTAALRSYANLGFVKVGECELFDKQFVCLEKEL